MRLQSKWRRKIEIEASELELAERRVHGTGLQHASEEAADSKVAEGPVPVGQVNDEKKQAGLAKKVARKLADPGGNPTMSFEDAAHALGVSRKHIYRLCDEGKLERAAGVSKVRTASVKALLEARA